MFVYSRVLLAVPMQQIWLRISLLLFNATGLPCEAILNVNIRGAGGLIRAAAASPSTEHRCCARSQATRERVVNFFAFRCTRTGVVFAIKCEIHYSSRAFLTCPRSHRNANGKQCCYY